MPVCSHATCHGEHDYTAKVRSDANSLNYGCDEGRVSVITRERHQDSLLRYALQHSTVVGGLLTYSCALMANFCSRTFYSRHHAAY